MAQDTSANLSSLTVSKTPPPTAVPLRVSVPVGDYEQVRADSRQFAIVPGHGDATVEVVITHEKTYDLVRKRPGEAAAIWGGN